MGRPAAWRREYITAGWDERDRLEFARLMLKYIGSLAQLKDRGLAVNAKGS